MFSVILSFVLTGSISASKNSLACYFQYRYSLPQDERDYFSLRRLALFGKNQFAKWGTLSYRFIFKSGNRSSTDEQIYLQEAAVDLHFSRWLRVKIGQFKPPFGWERFIPDYRVISVERSQVIDRLIPAGSIGASFARDYGIQVFNNAAKSPLSYELAVMTGSGANTTLTTKNAPLLVGRISFKKAFKILSLKKPWHWLMQVAYSYRHDNDIDLVKQLPGANEELSRHFKGSDSRFNAVLKLEIGSADFTAEYIRASFKFRGNSAPSVLAYGWYTQLSYLLGKNIEAFLKYETFDPDKSRPATVDIDRLTLGLNYYFNRKRSCLMLNYILKLEKMNGIKNDMVVFQLQHFLFDI